MYKILDDKYLPFKKNSLEYKVYKITNSFVQSKWDDQNPDIKKVKRIISLVKRSLKKQRIFGFVDQIHHQYDCSGNLKCVCPECKKKFIK